MGQGFGVKTGLGCDFEEDRDARRPPADFSNF